MSDGSGSGQDATADALAEGGDGGPLDTGVMEGGGCSCSTPVSAPNSNLGWLLAGLAVVASAVRRRKR
jgi:MYXO-CTERM domain-containing protein